MKSLIDDHLKQSWKVHSLLKDYKIEDIWSLPIHLTEQENRNEVLDQLLETKKNITEAGIVKNLFSFRLYLGRIFHWDLKDNNIEKKNVGEIAARYVKAESLKHEDLPKTRFGNFIPIYNLENEILLGLENNLVQAGIHLGKIEGSQKNFFVNMTVYVKARGLFGQIYMFVIKPFRILIVYPTLLKEFKIQWDYYIQNKNKLN